MCFAVIMRTSSFYIAFLLLLYSCSSSDDTSTGTLADLVAANEIVPGNVIACASGSEEADVIIAYAYPRPGATELRYFETENTGVDPGDFNNYTEVVLPALDFFNGYLMKFERQTELERWAIITFMEEGKLHLSNPIRLKHMSQNTSFTQMVTVDQSSPGMPVFNWNASAMGSDAIYFQVVADDRDNLLSGTYTFDTWFQYYELDNVVLNITRETPPDLIPGAEYSFTLMGVSEDNWVNTLDQIVFTTE